MLSRSQPWFSGASRKLSRLPDLLRGRSLRHLGKGGRGDRRGRVGIKQSTHRLKLPDRSGDRDNKATSELSGKLGQGWAAFAKYNQVLHRKQTLPILLAVFRLIYPLPSLRHLWKGPLLILMETRGSCIHSLTAAGGDSRPPAYSALSVHGHTLSRQPPPCVPPFGGVPGELGLSQPRSHAEMQNHGGKVCVQTNRYGTCATISARDSSNRRNCVYLNPIFSTDKADLNFPSFHLFGSVLLRGAQGSSCTLTDTGTRQWTPGTTGTLPR